MFAQAGGADDKATRARGRRLSAAGSSSLGSRFVVFTDGVANLATTPRSSGPRHRPGSRHRDPRPGRRGTRGAGLRRPALPAPVRRRRAGMTDGPTHLRAVERGRRRRRAPSRIHPASPRPACATESGRFLTDVIVEMGLLRQEHVDKAVEEAKATGQRPEQVMLSTGLLTGDQLARGHRRALRPRPRRPDHLPPGPRLPST